MALARTQYTQYVGAAVGNNPTTIEYTFPNGTLVGILAQCVNNGGAENPSTLLTIDDTGADLTWTSRALSDAGISEDYAPGARFWTATANGTPCTITVTKSGVAEVLAWRITPWTWTGADLTNPVGAVLQDVGPSDGAASETASASPAASSDFIASLVGVLNSGDPTVTHGTGWTELFDNSTTDVGSFQAQVRTGSTSSTIGWDDVSVDGGGFYHPPVLLGFEIKAAAGGQTVTVGLAEETDTVLSPARTKSKAVALTTETDETFAATVVGGPTVVVVGLTTETDSPLAAVVNKAVDLELAAEEDEALAATASVVTVAGLALEVDSVLSPTILKSEVVGLTTETDSPLAAAHAKVKLVGLATESDSAFAAVGQEPPVTITLFQGSGLSSRRNVNRRNRRTVKNLVKYSPYITTPTALGSIATSGTSSVFSLPAAGRLALSHTAALTAGQCVVAVGARSSFSHPELSAGQVYKGSYGERGMPVTVSRGNASAGTFTLYVIDLRGSPHAIATVTFS